MQILLAIYNNIRNLPVAIIIIINNNNNNNNSNN
jgi:hypothetical protein